MRIITLTIEDLATLASHGSVWSITGTGEDGERVTFGGEPRLMDDVAGALMIGDEDEVEVSIEDWQVLSTQTPPAELSHDDVLQLMDSLDKGSNLFGRLSADTRARLFAVVDRPTQETWTDASSILISAERLTTLWAAVNAHTDYPVRRKDHGVPWTQIPTSEQILTALKEALS
jgi:hypothetical protein